MQQDSDCSKNIVDLLVVIFFFLTSNIPLFHALRTEDNDRPMSVVGSPYWMAPEMLIKGCYGLQADVFSLGKQKEPQTLSHLDLPNICGY
jgi:serine/threonine protein kinase